MSQTENVWLRIVDSVTLARAREYLLDAIFAPDSIRLDEVKQVCCVKLFLPATDLATYKKIVSFLSWRTIPFRRWDLVLHGVSEYEVRHLGEPLREGMYSVANLDFNMKDGFLLITHEAMTIRFSALGIDGELAETEQIHFDRALRSLSVRFRAGPAN